MNKKNSKKQIIIAIFSLCFITLLLLGLTYAYYKTKIIGNPSEKTVDISVKKPNVEVIYSDDNNEIVATDIEPGYTSQEKAFTVRNTRNFQEHYSLVFDNIITDCSRAQDWTYELKQDDLIIRKGVISIKSKESYILENVSIDAGETHYYSVKISYLNSDEEQNEDIGKSMKLRINIDNAIQEFLPNVNIQDKTLLAAIKRDNSLSEPLTTPGKENSKVKALDLGFSENIENTSSLEYYRDNEWYYGESYYLNEETGKYDLTDIKKGKYSEIYSELKGKYLVSNFASSNSSFIDDDEDLKNLSGIYKVEEATFNNLLVRESLKVVLGVEEEISYTEDEEGISYYYRGAVKNNYVNFANMCWRIVRIQGDESIKIVLENQENECEKSNEAVGAYTSDKFDIKYKDSDARSESDLIYQNGDISSFLQDWYTTNIINTDFLVEAQWCNDLSISSKTTFSNYYVNNYGAYSRLYNNPSLRCDFIGKNDPNSSAEKIPAKIGILTADEVAFAGGAIENRSKQSRQDYFLTKNLTKSFWTMSPHSYSTKSTPAASVWIVGKGGMIISSKVSETYYVRPALVLKKTTPILRGTGTQKNPYIIDEIS